MKLLYLDIPIFFANKDMLDALDEYVDSGGNKLEVVRYHYDYEEKRARNDEEFEKGFSEAIRNNSPDFVFCPITRWICTGTSFRMRNMFIMKIGMIL